MKLKHLKRSHKNAWLAHKKTVAFRRVLYINAQLVALALSKAGSEWGRVAYVDEWIPGKPLYCTVYCKKGEEPKPVPAGEPICVTGTFMCSPQAEVNV